MVNNSRKGMLFGVVGLVVGVAAGAMGMLSLRGGDGPYATSPPTRMMGAAPATSTAFVAAVAGNCEMAPVLPNGNDGDGQKRLQAKPGAASASEVASLILSGKEAAAAGRQRDAETDFLNACRNAATLQDGDPVPLADAMYQLGRHYANVGAFGPAGKGTDLFQRAERLYSASLEGYRARYGEDHEKTRFAREGLVTVQHATGGKAPTAIVKAAPAPATAPAQPVEAAPAVAAASAPVTVVPAPVGPAAEMVKPQPPKDVAKAPAPAPRAPIAKPPTHEARAQDERARDEDDSATASVAPPRAAPAVVPAPAAERRPAPIIDGAVEPPRPRPQARRSPPPESAADESDVAVDVPPPPRRPRPAPPPEPTYEAPPPSVDTGTAGGSPSAEGSPDAP